ncbi:MAG: arginase family protein, partial [Bacteroidota bacterium]
SFRVADLGNSRKTAPSFVIPIVKELLDSDIFPILIGKDIDGSLAQYQAYRSRRFVNLAMVDEQIRLDLPTKKKAKDLLLNKILKKRKPSLFQFSHLAFQIHYTSPKVVDFLHKRLFDPIRLGSVKHQIEKMEPIIRDADLFCFNISALKAAEAPAQQQPSPSGLTSEEACQLSRYAGLSDKLTSAGFFGLVPEKDQDGRSAQVFAQLIWYLIDGFAHRKNDYPVSSEGLVEYVVEFKHSNHEIRFWKSKKSGRWWIQIPIKKGKKKKSSHYLFPCTYADYQMACQEDLPDRLLNAYKKFSG